MADPVIADEFYMEAFRISSITAYNRLESRPRTANFDRSLKAEVRDPLWMLTRQWQFGEFKGEDAATAMTTLVEGDHTVMDRIQFPGNIVFPYDGTAPLETMVEKEKIEPHLMLAVQMGRYFVKLMKTPLLSNFNQLFELLKLRYLLNYLPDENDREGNQLLRITAGKIFDGFLLYQDIITPQGTSNVFAEWVTAQAVADGDLLIALADPFTAWHRRNYKEPSEGISSPWSPSRLEYGFRVSSATQYRDQKTLTADQFNGGDLDWYNFDLNRDTTINLPGEQPSPNQQGSITKSYIPTPVVFKGMPNPRFWMMEDSQTDFGNIDTSPTGLLHLLLAEFGLTYSNDWFMLPYELPPNTLCEITKITVKDVFGEFTLIRPAGNADGSQWQQWSMFRHTDTSEQPSNSNFFYLGPPNAGIKQGEPLELVNLLRDEMANMVWGVENTVPSQAGKGVNGDQMALSKIEKPPFAGIPGATIRYVLGTTVPENWIPFIPVQLQGTATEIQLQRAKLPHAKGPLGEILSETPAPYYIQEEMVRRSGILVSRLFKRTRGNAGETYLWQGRSKRTGKGEGWSNLKFDQIEDIL